MPTQSGKRSDLPTVIAVAVVAYAASSVVHELIGHGTGCLLTGVKALRFTALEAIALWTEWPCCQCPRWDWCFLSVSETVEIHRLFLFSLALCSDQSPRCDGYLSLLFRPLNWWDWRSVFRVLRPRYVWRAAISVAIILPYIAVVRR